MDIREYDSPETAPISDPLTTVIRFVFNCLELLIWLPLSHLYLPLTHYLFIKDHCVGTTQT